jgi:hypothetical protein
MISDIYAQRCERTFVSHKPLKFQGGGTEEVLKTLTIPKGTCMKPEVAATTEILLKVDTRDMSPAQVRVLKQIHSLLVHTMTAEDEAEFFEATAQLFKQTAAFVGQAHFAETHTAPIAYGEQAVDYAIDFLRDQLPGTGNIDN